MVYQGKPSAGCANCRKRKIKCDEGIPACSQCINTKRECPGYVARFDLVLRDQTKAVRRKAQRKRLASETQTRKNSADQISPASDDGAIPNSTQQSLVKRSNSADDTLPRIFNDFPEQQAICAFFLDFVLIPRHPDSFRGPLEHLLPLYQKAGSQSPVCLATSAVALAISGGSPHRRSDQQLGRTVFGKALQRTSKAIRHPVESLEDETLMAVLLLGLYERITSNRETVKSNMLSTHNAGAQALVRHRGKENCKSPLSIGILFAVRTQLVEHAIECGQAFQRCPDHLSNIFRLLPQNASARLTSATINIADLRFCAKSALKLPRSPASEKEVNDLLEYAISIDLLVSAWSESVPGDWQWTPSDAFDLPSPPLPKSAFVYTSSDTISLSPTPTLPVSRPPDVYLDLWVLSIWNQYRAARIKIQRIILDCIAYLGAAYDAQWYWRGVYATMTVQEMVDDVCASVPMALGSKTFGGPSDRDGVEYPYLRAKGKQSGDHARAANAMGGWHLLDPLKAALRDSGTCLRDGQIEWMAGQMERIARIYGLQGQRGMGVGGGAMSMRFTPPINTDEPKPFLTTSASARMGTVSPKTNPAPPPSSSPTRQQTVSAPTPVQSQAQAPAQSAAANVSPMMGTAPPEMSQSLNHWHGGNSSSDYGAFEGSGMHDSGTSTGLDRGGGMSMGVGSHPGPQMVMEGGIYERHSWEFPV